MAIDLLEQIHPHIKSSIYPQRVTLPDWRMKEGDFPNAASIGTKDRSWTSIRIPFQWGKFDTTYWFRQTIAVPPDFAGKPLVLLLNFPEALLYVNGKPFHGIDQHHKEILLCSKAKPNEEFVLAVQAYSRRTHVHTTFAFSELAVLDTTARRLDSALTILQDLEKFLDHGSMDSKEIRDLIRRTLIFLKYFKPGSEEYPHAIQRAYNFLLNTLETELKTTHPGLVFLIGHSHIDTAWLWTLQETARKCGRTFSSMLRLMEEFPELKFSQSQPVLYEFTKEHYPDLYKQIKQRCSEGRWEPVGAMWTEADCNIPNGESLIRQILFGKRFFKQEFGIDPNTVWLPDSFGFTWALPQILLKSGITHFYTSKLTWNDTTRFPYTSFWWQGIDKSKVLAHISPLGLESQITPKALFKSGDPSQADPTSSPILHTYGYGDGGGGVTKEHLEFAVVLKSIPGLPVSRLSSVQEFFKHLEEQSASLPTWNNELYLESHRGTYTTQAMVKKENRVCENLLYTTELLSTLALLFGKNNSARRYPRQELEQAWKKLLFNQFHDILSGTVIEDAFKAALQDYQALRTTCETVIASCIQGISQPTKKSKSQFHFALFNSCGWTRSEYVELSVKSDEKHLSVVDTDGKPIESQIIERTAHGQKLLCFVDAIPPFGCRHLIVKSQKISSLPALLWKTSTHGIESPFFRVRFDSKGALSSLYDKHLRREIFQKGKRGNSFITFRDTAKQWEAWNLENDFEKHHFDLWDIKQIKISEAGPLRATVKVEYKSEHGSLLTQHIHFYHESSRIDFQTHVRWQEKQVLMKVAFPLNMKTSHATYDIQFGAIRRSSKPHTDWEKAKTEVPAQQWADMSDAKFGVSILNDSKYGYDAKDNTLRLTLLRAPHYPHPIDPARPDEGFIDQGDHTFCYALHSHAGDWTNGQTVRRAREFNNPILVFPNLQMDSLPLLLEPNKLNISIDLIKKAEASDDIIIRMHEAHGSQTDTSLQMGLPLSRVMECDLLENDQKEHKMVKSKLLLKFKPFEIKTLKLTVKPSKKKK